MITRLMGDVVARVPALSFIDLRNVLVFARGGRQQHRRRVRDLPLREPAGQRADALQLARSQGPSRQAVRMVRRPFAGRADRRPPDRLPDFVFAPTVLQPDARTIQKARAVFRTPGNARRDRGGFAVPRSCAQTARFSPSSTPSSTSCIHIDPGEAGIRRLERADGGYSKHSHGAAFYREVARMASEYLESRPDPALFEFLRDDARGLVARHGEVLGTAFRTFPSYPQRTLEAAETAAAARCRHPGRAAETFDPQAGVQRARSRNAPVP